LLAALRDETQSRAEMQGDLGPFLLWVNAGFVALFVVVSWGLLHALSISDGVRLSNISFAAIPDSGVSHPVTAVLLNFRAYDTLLELAVVFSAVLGILALGPARRDFQPPPSLLSGLIRGLVPLLIVTAGYLLWVGAHAPGGAFQAGASLAAAGILLRLGGYGRGGLPRAGLIRWMLVAGVAVFVLVGLAVMIGERAALQYPGSLAGVLILLIETAATLSIAAALVLAYIGGRPSDWDAPDSDTAQARD
jgi:multisubunit Na+/H+ antiporter MnhB subunit